MKTLLITHPVRIVVPAYKATDTIDTCITHILQACTALSDVEIVIVSHQTTIQLPPDRRVHIIHSEKALNAGEARNAGARYCGDRILVFVDADVLIDRDALIALLQPILDGTADATVGNYATDLISKQFYQNYKKIYIHQAYAREGYMYNEFWTAFSAITGKCFANLGGFSAEFSHKGGEDTELGIRLSEDGYRIYAVSKAQGRHLKTFTFWSLVRNDLDKGTRTICLALNRRTPLHQNRHAGKSDQLAVGLACLLPVLSGMILFFLWPVVFLPMWLALYVGSRGTFFLRCLSNGIPFTTGAIGLSWVLDIVRAISVFNGFRLHLLNRSAMAQDASIRTLHMPSSKARA